MDFAQLDLRAASERGSWIDLKHPLIPDGEKPRIRVRGIGAKGVLEAFRTVERVQALKATELARATNDEAESVLAQFQDRLEQALGSLIVAAVAEWEQVEWGENPLEVTPENVLNFCGPGTLFFSQVNEAIADQQRLFTKPDSAS